MSLHEIDQYIPWKINQITVRGYQNCDKSDFAWMVYILKINKKVKNLNTFLCSYFGRREYYIIFTFVIQCLDYQMVKNTENDHIYVFSSTIRVKLQNLFDRNVYFNVLNEFVWLFTQNMYMWMGETESDEVTDSVVT